jgi:hypothetical protein
MTLKDLFLTPVYLIIIYLFAYLVRSKVTDINTKKYFIPALTLKFVGAICVGLIYYFYYAWGDTKRYFAVGKVFYQAFHEDFSLGVKLLLSDANNPPAEVMKYIWRMPYIGGETTFFISKITGLLNLISFNTYSVTALFFAIISFSGIWALYQTFYKIYPFLHKEFAVAVLFIPSVFFWGSGILKDPISLAALGWFVFGFYFGVILRKNILKSIIILIISVFILKSVKIYILLSIIPPAILWAYFIYNDKIKSAFLRLIIKPVLFMVALIVVYLGITKFTGEESEYALQNISTRSSITSGYIEKRTEEVGGSGYKLAAMDGSIRSMIINFPLAVNVALYRPYLWEVRNPIMLLSAFESTWIIIITIMAFTKNGVFQSFRIIMNNNFILFCLIFSLIFGFAVGFSTLNFGSLVRYKIPLIPFYIAAMFVLKNHKKLHGKVKKNGKARFA